jgi:ABC-2 type transport system permease protein
VNRVLLFRTWRAQLGKVVLIAVVSSAWGWLMPFFYSQFSGTLRELAKQNPLFGQLSNFGSGSILTLPGTITLGTQHPFAITLVAVFAVGVAGLAIAGERQAGTLEVLLARPIPRRTLFVTIWGALLVLVAVVVAALVVGMVIGVVTQGLLAELDLGQMPFVWLNGLLLWSAFLSFSLAMSATFDRTGPAIGLSLAFLLLNYFLEILGSLWTDAAWTQEYSLFHHFQPSEILSGKADPFDFVLLVVVIAIPLAFALLLFPRRDLAAPA